MLPDGWSATYNNIGHNWTDGRGKKIIIPHSDAKGQPSNLAIFQLTTDFGNLEAWIPLDVLEDVIKARE